VTGGLPDGGRFLTVAEVAVLLGIRCNSAERLCRIRELPAVRVGRQYRVPESAALAWLEANPRRNRPVWPEIAGDLRKMIADLPPDARLPGPAALADRYGTSTGPPTKALLHLRDEGLVYLVPCTGFYVSAAGLRGAAAGTSVATVVATG
jgi:excisionase family DNA binding protein